MEGFASITRQGDGRLWAIALVMSLVVNLGILGVTGIAMVRSEILRRSQPAIVSPPSLSETTITIFPEVAAAASGAVSASAKPRFVRTSEDQSAPAPESTPFIGERNTQATSDRAPDLAAPPLPSQAGMDREDLETTESRYQDGRLGSGQPSKPQEAMPVLPAEAVARKSDSEGETISEESTTSPEADAFKSTPAPEEKLLKGTSSVDVPVPKRPEESNEIKPTTTKHPKNGESTTKTTENQKTAAASKPITDPAFAGYQRKAAIVGSISRTGRSALSVADSPLGRYQALISRAVELEWQRNCVRHRDFITPGFLTVRFFVETSGKVRTVQFLGQMETGEVQKGFTLNSIRDADIPAMPAAVKKDFDKEPLELIFNFYF